MSTRVRPNSRIRIRESRGSHSILAFLITMHSSIWLAVWLSGNALASINVVALRQTRLVFGWVTICGQVNHRGM